MRNILSIKFIFFLLLPFLLLQGLMMPNDLHGKDHSFSWGIYKKNLPSPDMIDAVLDVRKYFEALCEGRIDIIHEMMDESLREEYRLSLNDPSYPGLLRKIYGGSKMIIKHIYRKDVGSFEIDAQLITPKSGTTEVRFEVEKEMARKSGLQSHRLRSFAVKN